jgi:hypothetical protein
MTALTHVELTSMGRQRSGGLELADSHARVYGYLHSHAMFSPRCCPSQELVGTATGLTRERVNRICRDLRDMGLLSWEKAKRAGSRWTHNVYSLKHWCALPRARFLALLAQVRERHEGRVHTDGTALAKASKEDPLTTPFKPLEPKREGSSQTSRTIEQGLMSVCPTCGLIHEENAALRATIAKQSKQMVGLEQALRNATRTGPLMAEITEVFFYWVERHGKRKDTVLGDARIKAVRARLKEGFTVVRLKKAIDGCVLDDWAMGRVKKTNGKTFNDLAKHICVSDEAVERFEQMTEKPAQPTPLRVVQSRDDPFSRPLDRALVALRREFGWDSIMAQWEPEKYHAESWWAPCPLHPAIGQPMRIREQSGRHGGRLEFACAQGCLPTVLFEAVRELEYRDANQLGPVAA